MQREENVWLVVFEPNLGASTTPDEKLSTKSAFGQMKVRQKAGYLRLRGLQGAQIEWTLHSICHNLRKLSNSRVTGGFVMA
ncbi:MAG: transposase [Ferrimicrobium sp.]